MTAPRDTRLRRSLRRFTLGSGPLKRGSDRVQLIGRLVVVLSFLVAPPLAVAAATSETTHLEALAAAEAAERHRTSAVLLEDAPPATHWGGAEYTEHQLPTVPARATWSAPDGSVREGLVRAHPRTPVGTTVPVWVDDEGNIARAPLDRAAIPGSALAMGLVPLLGVPLAAWTLYAVLCWALDAHRERRWAQGWADVEREWGTRLL